MKKRIVLALIVGTAVFGGAYASATTLGGITDNSLGANTKAVAACDTDGITSTYTTTYSTANKRYEVATVAIGGIASGCAGKTLKVTLTTGAGATVLWESTGTTLTAAASQSVAVTAGTSAETVDNISVAVFG